MESRSRPGSRNLTIVGDRAGRRIHLVGSLPADLVESSDLGMRWVLDRVAGAPLVSLPGDRDPVWIVDYLRSLERVASLEKVKGGEFRSDTDFPRYKVRKGQSLSPCDVELGRASEVQSTMAVRSSFVEPLPPLQVSIPSPLDLSVFAFGSASSAFRQLPVFVKSLTGEMEDIYRSYGNEVGFQIESPMILNLFDRAPRVMWLAISRLLARQIANLVSVVPKAQSIVHLCYGDLGHRPLLVPQDLRPAALFVNSLKSAIADIGGNMPAVHIPVSYGDSPPPQESSFYRPLSTMSVEVNVIAGLVAERHPLASQAALRHFEEALGRPVYAVSAACGLGRRSARSAADNIQLSLEIAEISSMETKTS